MNPKGKKFISQFLAFSLMMLSVNLYAKERRGAKLSIIITKKDGQAFLIEGELIAVKPNSLLLLDTEGKVVSFGVADIRIITIVKKSKAVKGALYGLIIGFIGRMIWVLNTGSLLEGVESKPAIDVLVIGGATLIGGLIGNAAGKDKTIQIEGMTDSEIQETLDYLRKKARVRDYK